MNEERRNGYCDFTGAPVPFHKHVSIRQRIIDGLLAVTSLAILWMIMLMIDGNAGVRVSKLVKTSVATEGSLATEMGSNVSHVTRSVWELSYVYGPLMTFAIVALILVIVMNRSTK